MKINLKNNIVVGGFVLASLFFTNCANNENNFADFPTSSKPLVTAPTTSFTVTEGETVDIPLNLEYVIDKRIDLQIIVTSGNATIFDDYSIGDGPIPGENGNPETGFIARFPAYSESLSIPVDAILDMIPEGSETVTVNIAATGLRTAITQDGGIDVTFTINNFATDNLGVILSWDSDVTYNFVDGTGAVDTQTDHLCDIVDFDLIANPGGYIVGSADCPEITYDGVGGSLADGTYELYTDLYDVAPSEAPVAPFDIPFTLTIAKVGQFMATVSYDDLYNSSSPTSAPAGNGPGLALAATLVVSGGNYTVYDKDGNLVAAE